MAAMIRNDDEKEWMMPLLDLRNALDFRNGPKDASGRSQTDRHLRDFRRMSGAVQLMKDGRIIPGPYTQEARGAWLKKLLAAQTHIRRRGPASVRDIELIGLEDLQEIRRIWVIEKHELEDTLPSLYREATGEPYPGRPLDDNLMIGAKEMDDLRALCGDDRLHYEMTRDLLSLTRQQRNSARRAGLKKRIEQVIRRNFYDDPDDAIHRAKRLGAERKGLTADRPEGRSGQMGSVSAETTPDPASSDPPSVPERGEL
jgi:DNA sulfur modification protein DndC